MDLEKRVQPEQSLAQLGTRFHARHALVLGAEPFDRLRDMRDLLGDLLVIDLHRRGRAPVVAHEQVDGRIEVLLLGPRMREQLALKQREERVEVVARAAVQRAAHVLRELTTYARGVVAERLADVRHLRLLASDGRSGEGAAHRRAPDGLDYALVRRAWGT